jgi:hypothetical protein
MSAHRRLLIAHNLIYAPFKSLSTLKTNHSDLRFDVAQHETAVLGNDIKLPDLFFILLAIIILLRFRCFFEIQHHTIDAITQSCWWWAVIKHMAKVRFAPAALNFRSCHAMRIVRRIDDAGF